MPQFMKYYKKKVTKSTLVWCGVYGEQQAANSASAQEEQILMNAYIREQTDKIDALILSVQGAPPEELVPALELLAKIYGAIIDKPDEPKVIWELFFTCT